MGRAIVRNPKVFLFDEPLSNLDAKLRVQVRTEIKKLHERVATTIIYVTHDQVEAMTLADRIVVLKNGRIEQIGTPEEVYDDPGHGLRRGVHRRADHEPRERSPGVRRRAACPSALSEDLVLPIPPTAAAATTTSAIAEILVGLRPEHLAVVPARAPALPSTSPRRSSSRSAPTRWCFFTAGGREMVARVPPGAARRRGDRVRLHPEVSHMHLFDPSTEARI